MQQQQTCFDLKGHREAFRKGLEDLKKERDNGANAFMAGKSINDNPFNCDYCVNGFTSSLATKQNCTHCNLKDYNLSTTQLIVRATAWNEGYTWAQEIVEQDLELRGDMV
jgi:hypothetical protein